MKKTLLLDAITDPKDIKKLSFCDLEILSKEIRQRIIEVLSKTGGHLASNLGIVELTIALHRVFDSPHDHLLFDTSHQTYPHKLLTGRNKRFDTLRQFNGLCGFANPKESDHDHFFAGHAGTALSLSLGIAKSRDNDIHHIIPILGDGSLTCGLTLEALNNLPEDLSRFIVILNDNKMSISKSVGNIKNILSRLLSNPISNKILDNILSVVSKTPLYGKFLSKLGRKVNTALKHIVSPATFFEQFGLSYIGPIDGHNIKKLVDTFFRIKNQKNPVIVHVLTTKGKGMNVAIDNPTPYHGVQAFDISTGSFFHSSKTTFPKIFGRFISSLAQNDPDIFLFTPAMLEGSSLTEFKNKYPHQCIDVGIAEGHCVTCAGAMAKTSNKKVVACIYSTFLQRAFDNIYQDVCLQNSPVIFALDRAGLSGRNGPTHHGIYDIGFLQAMPNMIIAQPRNGQLLKELLLSSFSWKRPTALRYPNHSTEEGSGPLKTKLLGEAELLLQGSNLLIIALGDMYKVAFDVAEQLKNKNIFPTIVDPIFIKPLDEEFFLQLLASHRYIVTIEEHAVKNGLGNIFNSFLAQNNLLCGHEIINIGFPDQFIGHGKDEILKKELGLDAQNIVKRIIDNFYIKHNVSMAQV